MKKWTKDEIIKGITCETCSSERKFGSPPNSSPDNLYVYVDLGGSTRCFCKEHMSYSKDGEFPILVYEDDWNQVCFAGQLISEIISHE